MPSEIPTEQLNITDEVLAENATQVMLQKACKRLLLSCNVQKRFLVARLNTLNIKTHQDVIEKATQFETNGAMPASESTVQTTARKTQPPWTPLEHARLIHVLRSA